MWLLPALSHVSSIAARAFYRLSLAGERVPASGPVLLVANHPNSLLDPVLAATAAGRPVRFLAKAPLFTDPAVGWLARASGAIPVYRASEDPSAPARNADVFRAVHEALAEGFAVGIFPEGTTHNEPSLVPLKTGAARMALGAAALMGAAFPIIPIGLTFRDKERFRSDALVVVGEPVSWEDLANRGEAAARELTRRIDAALRRVTVNVERWEDRPLLEAAEAIYAAEAEASPAPAQRVSRLQEAAQTLAELRRYAPERWQPLAADVQEHRRMLVALGASPESLRRLPAWGTALRWTAGKVGIWLVAGPLLLVGSLLFWFPHRAPGWIVTKLGVSEELRATYKVLIGFVAFVLWIAALGLALSWRFGAAAGMASLVVLPLFAAATLALHDRWRDTLAVARGFLQLRRRDELRAALRQRQQMLARRLVGLVNSQTPHSPASP